jgi:hypothetical protein
MGQSLSQSEAGRKSFNTTLRQVFDIKSQIIQVERFANKFVNYFIEMVKKIVKYTKKLIFGSFKYSKVVVTIFTILFTGIILFSKNKYAGLLVLVYFFIGYITLWVFTIFLLFVLIIAELAYQNVKFWISLAKEAKPGSDDPPKMNGKKIWKIIKNILIIFLIIFLIFCLGGFSYVLKFLSVSQTVIFESVNALYTLSSRGMGALGSGLGAAGSGLGSGLGSMGSGLGQMGQMGAMGAMGAMGKGLEGSVNIADSFGGILRKILERCS